MSYLVSTNITLLMSL